MKVGLSAKNSIIFGLAVALLPASASAQQSVWAAPPNAPPSRLNLDPPRGNLDLQIKRFDEKSARVLLAYASLATTVLTAYADEPERDRLAQQLAQTRGVTDPGELVFFWREILPSLSLELIELANAPDLAERSAKLTPQNQQQIRARALSFVLLGLQVRGLVESGQSLINDADARPEQPLKTLAVRETLALLTSSIATLSLAGPKFSSAFKTAARSMQLPGAEPRSEPRIEPRSEPRTEPRFEPRSDPRSDPRSEPRSEPS